jgi:hypothetical protein
VDEILERLAGALEPGDVVADGGNPTGAIRSAGTAGFARAGCTSSTLVPAAGWPVPAKELA